MSNEKKPTKAKKIISVIVDIILVVYLVFAVSLCIVAITSAQNDGIPSVFGYSLFTIESDSMETGENGSINKGDLIISKKLEDPENTVAVGDVITFKARTTLEDGTEVRFNNSHRVIRIEKAGDIAADGTSVDRTRFITQGDNPTLNVEDPDPVYPENVLAKYTGHKISGGGSVIKFLQSRTGIMICFVIPLAAFFLYALIRFIRNIMMIKYGKKTTAEELSEEEKARIAQEYMKAQGMTPASDEQPSEKDSVEEMPETSEENRDSDKS